jgi:CheY-like chemotaxis protein
VSRRRTVLLVEDNAGNAEMTGLSLALAGWDVERAGSGTEALERMALSCPAVFCPDVVLLDLMLPGMDGVTLLREMAARPHIRGVPVVVLTAAAEDAQARAREAYPGVTVLQKPAEPAAIVAALGAAAGKAGGP